MNGDVKAPEKHHKSATSMLYFIYSLLNPYDSFSMINRSEVKNIFVVICIEKTSQYIFQNVFYYVPWKKESYMGLEQHQDRIFIYE